MYPNVCTSVAYLIPTESESYCLWCMRRIVEYFGLVVKRKRTRTDDQPRWGKLPAENRAVGTSGRQMAPRMRAACVKGPPDLLIVGEKETFVPGGKRSCAPPRMGNFTSRESPGVVILWSTWAPPGSTVPVLSTIHLLDWLLKSQPMTETTPRGQFKSTTATIATSGYHDFFHLWGGKPFKMLKVEITNCVSRRPKHG